MSNKLLLTLYWVAGLVFGFVIGSIVTKHILEENYKTYQVKLQIQENRNAN